MTTGYSASDETAFDGELIVVKTWEDGREYIKSHDVHGTYVSVTTVLTRVFGEPFPEAARGNVEHARERGTEVHRTISLICGGLQGPRGVGAAPEIIENLVMDPEVEPRVKLICDWMNERHWIPGYIERAFFSKKYGVAGTPDQVGKFDDDEKFTVLDFKPWVSSRARLQTAGYALLVRESLGLDYVPNRVVLHVKDDRVREIWHERHARDKAVFLSALNCHTFGIEEGIWK